MKIKLFLVAFTICFTCNAKAETNFELQLSTQTMNLRISEKRGPTFEDSSSNIGIGLAVYRRASQSSSFGAVIEYSNPMGREAEFGSGKITGIRPVNWLYSFGNAWESELYLGAAQYQWEKTARGYYWGVNLRRKFNKLSLAVGYRYYQDLGYDSSLGDVIVDGNSFGLSLNYSF